MIRKSVLRVRVLLLMGLLAGTCCWIGCGGEPSGSVSGKVTYNGKPVTIGGVLFVNPDTGIGASAELDASGSYKVLSLRTGEYQVTIQRPRAPSPEEMAKGAQLKKPDVPDKYLDPQTSGMTATITEGKNSVDFTL